MSASLVGSEMCIRDSRRGARPRPCGRRPRPQAHRPPQPEPQRRRGRRTVSYTHLTLPTICSV
eukprot:9446036-Alexandrium_andersonii.AAC.1